VNAFTRRQKTVWKTAVAVPATLLIGLGGSALMAAPALADTAPAPTAASTSATPAASATATAAPTATATAPATVPATPAPSVTHAVTPKPTAKVAAAAPATLTVTSPTPEDPNSDNPTPVQMTSRTFDVTGTAPVGSYLEVDDSNGTALGTLTTTTTSFSIPVTIAADAPYEQELDVFGTAGRTYLDDTYLYLEFPAATAVAPVLDTPATTSFTVAPLPLGFGTFGNPVKVTGTGTPGDYVELFSTSVGATPDTSDDPDDPYGDGTQSDLIPVGTDGTWTGYATFDYGTTDLWAAQQQFFVDARTTADFGEAVTHTSPFAGPQAITLTKPAGTVDAPEITKPAYDFSSLFGSGSSTSASGGLSVGRAKASSATTGSTSHAASTTSAPADTRDRSLAASLPTAADPFANLTPEAVAASNGDTVRVKAKAGSTSSTSDSADSEIAQDGIQVKGTPSTTRHGYLTTTVAGTGTPGDHVVVYAQDGDTASSYVEALYPQLFQELDAYITELNDSNGTTPVVPPTITTNTVTSLLPADDGSITVAADGTWSTTVTLKPGSYGVMAFVVDPSTKVYSSSSELLGVHLTGTPILDPASTSTSELAFTGSQHSMAIGIGGLAAIAAGGALLVIARRRRQEV
jgi:LPXTG-motif cell wall-anchored protein